MSWKERPSFSSKRSLNSDSDAQPVELMEFKVVMVGTMSVGKTSLAGRYVKDSYRDYVNPTIGASYLWRKERIDDRDVKLSIWDTAGQEQFYALVPMYFRDADAVILVVDTTRSSCEEEAVLWLDKVKQSAPSSAIVFLVINKIDCEGSRVYLLPQAQQFCKQHAAFRMECAEVSAKTGQGVHDLFERVGRVCIGKTIHPETSKSKETVRLGASPTREQRRGDQEQSDKCKC